MNEEDFFGGLSLPRNKEIMRIYRDLNMVEQLGSGVPRILKVYPKSSFIFGNSFIRMVFVASEPVYDINTGGATQITTQKTTQKIIKLISQNKYITTLELAESLNRSRSAIAKQIAKLKEESVIPRIGPDKGGYWEIKK